MRWLINSGLFFLLLRLGSSLECFTCSSTMGLQNPMGNCENFQFYQNHRRSVCMPGDQVCAKYIVEHDGMLWVHRSCKPYDICGYLRQVYSNGKDQLLECSTCSDANLCNSSIAYSASMKVLLLFLFLVKLGSFFIFC